MANRRGYERTLLLCCTLFLLMPFSANSFEVTNTVSPLTTRTGCKVVLTCGGFGTGIEWRKFGQTTALVINDKQNTTSESIDVPDEDLPYFIATATITASPEINNERFQCFIFEVPPYGITITHPVQLRVEKIVAIEPEIQTVDISSYHIGSQVTIGCPVQTCASQVRVQFLKGETAIGTPITVMEEDTSSSYNLVLDVTDDIRATYACKVDTMNPDDSVIMEFQVTGTPLPAVQTEAIPTITKPSTSTSTDSSTTDSSTTVKPTTPDNNDSSIAHVARLSLLVALLVLSVLFSV